MTLITHNIPERVDTRDGRHYITPCGLLPSVTTILAATSPPDKVAGLLRWRQKIGEEAAELSRVSAAARGTEVHEEVERLIKTKEIELCHLDHPNPWVRSISDELGGLVVNERILLCESACWHTAGFAGTFDLLTDDIFNCFTLRDWKTSEKRKKAEWIEDYYLQAAAYCAALREMYGIDLRKARICIAYERRKADVFEMGLQELKDAWRSFQRRLRMYKERTNAVD